MPHTIHTPPTLLLQVLAIFLVGGLPPINPSASAPHSAVMVMSSSSARSRLGNPVTLFVGGLKPGQTKYHIVQTPLLFNAYSSQVTIVVTKRAQQTCTARLLFSAYGLLQCTPLFDLITFFSDIFVSIFKSSQYS